MKFKKLKTEIAEFKRKGYLKTETVEKLTEEMLTKGGAVYWTGYKMNWDGAEFVRFEDSIVWVEDNMAYINYSIGTDSVNMAEDFEEDEAMYEGETTYDRASDWVYGGVKACIEHPEKYSLVIF